MLYENSEKSHSVLPGWRCLYSHRASVARTIPQQYVPVGRKLFSAAGETGATLPPNPPMSQGFSGCGVGYGVGAGYRIAGKPGFCNLGLPEYALQLPRANLPELFPALDAGQPVGYGDLRKGRTQTALPSPACYQLFPIRKTG